MTSRDTDCRLSSSCSRSESIFKFETTMYTQDFVEHYDTGGKYDIGTDSILGNLRMQLLGNTHNASEYNSQIPNLNVQLHTSTSGKANELFKWRGLPCLYLLHSASNFNFLLSTASWPSFYDSPDPSRNN